MAENREPPKAGSNGKGLLILLGVAVLGFLVYLSQQEPDYGETNEYAFLGPLIIGAVIFGFVGMLVGGNKKMGAGAGWWWGFFLGPLGVIIVAVSESAPSDSSTAPAGPALGRAALPPAPPGTAAGWLPDPTGRFQSRYWDGGRWTEHVHNGTSQHVDPV